MDRKKLITAAALLVGALVIVIAVMSDDQGLNGVSGTMATPDTVTGVQAATRYRAPQIARNDLQLDDPTFVQLMQNESFREIVQSGNFALIAAIEELSRTADLGAVADLARTEALSRVDEIASADEFADVSALAAAEIPFEDLTDAAQDGSLSALAEIARDQGAFSSFKALVDSDELVRIVDMAKEKPENEDFTTLDVVEEVYEKDFGDDFKELLEALEQEIETGPDAPRDEDWIKRKFGRAEFARSPVADRIVDLYRAGYLDSVRDLARTGFLARVEGLYRSGYLDDVGRLARTEGALERVNGMFRTEGRMEAFARVAAAERFNRTIAYMRTESFRLTAKLGRVEAIRAVGDLARAGYLDQVDRFARTEGFSRMADLAQAGKLWRVSELAQSGELARTIGDY